MKTLGFLLLILSSSAAHANCDPQLLSRNWHEISPTKNYRTLDMLNKYPNDLLSFYTTEVRHLADGLQSDDMRGILSLDTCIAKFKTIIRSSSKYAYDQTGTLRLVDNKMDWVPQDPSKPYDRFFFVESITKQNDRGLFPYVMQILYCADESCKTGERVTFNSM